jgi:hypothetical protein
MQSCLDINVYMYLKKTIRESAGCLFFRSTRFFFNDTVIIVFTFIFLIYYTDIKF